MSTPRDEDPAERRLATHIVSASATLVGASLTVVGALWVVNRLQGADSFADEVLASDAVISLAACALAYASLRTRSVARAARLETAADACFLVALALMTAACAMIAYAIA